MAKKPKKDDDDLAIPDFLLAKNRKPSKKSIPSPPEKTDDKKVSVAADAPEIDPRLARLSPPAQEYVLEEVRRGRYRLHWLDDPGGVKFIENKVQEREERKERQRLALAAARDRLPRRVSATKGMIPLKKLNAEVGRGLTKRQARTAVDEAKLEHVKYHFVDADAVLARVRVVLSQYIVPEKAGRVAPADYPQDAVISFPGPNPKKAGSAPHPRWQFLKEHHKKTVGAYLEKKGNPTTLRNAIAAGHVELKGGTIVKKAVTPAPEPTAPVEKATPEKATPKKAKRKKRR